MTRSRHYKRHEIPPGTFVNLVPLVDVLMQLILFLMIMGTWSRANQIELSLPQSSSTVKSQDRQIMVVTYQLHEGKAQVTCNGESVASLETLGKAMNASASGKEKPVVNVRIEKAVPYQDVIAVMDVVRDAGFPKFSLLTLESVKRAK